MSEESFLNQLQQVKKGKGSSRGKQTQKISPRKENDDNNNENPLPDIKLSKKNRSTKPILNTEADVDLDMDQIGSNRDSSK